MARGISIARAISVARVTCIEIATKNTGGITNVTEPTAAGVSWEISSRARLFTSARASASVALVAKCTGSCRDDGTDKRLGDFMTAYAPALRTAAAGAKAMR